MQQLDLGRLVFGQHLGEHPVDADLAGDRLGGAVVVAGDHHHLETEVMHPTDRRHRVVFDGVGHGHHPGQLAVDADHHGGLALVGEPFQDGLGRPGGNPLVGHELQVPQHDTSVIDVGGDPVTGDRFESIRFGDVEPSTAGAGDDCVP